MKLLLFGYLYLDSIKIPILEFFQRIINAFDSKLRSAHGEHFNWNYKLATYKSVIRW